MSLPFRILQRLAQGSMAEVMLVEREGAGGAERVALKRVLPVYLHDEEVVRMFIDEARLLAYLEHRAVPRLLELSFSEGEPYMLLELVEGADLDTLLAEGPLALPVALHIASEVAAALAHAHRAVDERGQSLGVVHRDVRPGNVMVTPTGTVKLIDFGIARWADRDRKTAAGHTVGAAGYLAPEQIRGEPASPAADVYAFGLMLVEMVTGERLFSSRDITARVDAMMEARLPEALPDAVRPLADACLRPHPVERLTDGVAILAAMAELADLADGSALADLVSARAFDERSLDMPHTAIPSAEDDQ